MKPTIVYPLQESATGDVLLSGDYNTIAESKARMTIDCRIGERQMLDAYGSNIDPGSPTSISKEAEASILQIQLNLWNPKIDETPLSYSVYAVNPEFSDRLELEIRINGI